MRHLSACLVLAAGLLVVAGCSKDSTTTGPSAPAATVPSLVGTWTVVTAPNNMKHLEFRSDNVFYLMNQYSYGLRDLAGGVYQVSGNAIDLGNTQYPSLYAFAIKNDTLTLVSPPSTQIVAYRNPSAPSDTSWVKNSTVLDSIPAPIMETTDITVNGNTLWYGNGYSSSHLFKIDLVSRSVDTLAVTGRAMSVEWDGTNLWTSNDGSDRIYKLNSTGTVIGTSAAMGAWIQGIAWDGSIFWVSSWNERSIYRYNPTSNTVLTTLPLGSQVEGLATAGGFVYVCVDGAINKCSTTPFTTVAAYRVRNAYAAGIAFDGTNFWVACRIGNFDDPAANAYRIYKVALP